MADSVRKIIEEFLANMRDDEALPKALAKAAVHGTFLPNDVLVQELKPLVEEIDRLKGSRPDFELAASLVCRQVAEGGPFVGPGGLTDQALKADITFLLGRSMLFAGHLDQADQCLQEAERVLQDLGHREKLPAVLATRGSLSLALGDGNGALSLFRKAENLFQELDDPLGEASAKYGIAQALSLQGETATARNYYLSALELNRSRGQTAEEFRCLVMLAQTFDDVRETEEKAKVLSEAVATASSASIDLSLRLQALAKLGTLHVRLEDKTKAVGILDEGLTLSLDAGDRYFESFFATNLGSVFAMLGRASDARRLFSQALSASKAIGDTEGVVIAERNLALLASKRTIIDSKVQIHRVGTEFDPMDKPEPDVQSTLDELIQEARRLRQSSDPLSQLRSETQVPLLTDQTATALVNEVLHVGASQADPLLTLILLMLVKPRLPSGFDTQTRIVILARIAAFADRSNQPALAMESLAEARALAKDHGFHDEWLSVSANLATLLRRIGKTAESLSLFEEVMSQIGTTAKPGVKAGILANAATAYSDLGQHQRSLELSESAIAEIANDSANQELLLISSINAACSYVGLDRVDDAELRFTEALSLARNLGNAAQEAVCLGHIGSIRMKQGKISAATNLFEQAAQKAESVGDLWNAQHWYFDLGNLYQWTGSDSRAQFCFEKALAISRQVGDLRSEARASLGLGMSSQGDDSINHLFSAWKSCHATGNTSLAVEVALQLVHAYEKQAVGLKELTAAITAGTFSQTPPENRVQDEEALKQARAWFDQARALASQYQGGSDRDSHIVLAETELLRLEGRTEEAIANLQSVSKTSTDPFQVRNSHTGLGGIYFHDMKDPARALPHFEEAIAAQEAINIQITFAEHRIENRNDAAALYLWTAECALALGLKEKAFAICERAKNRELHRLWSYRHDEPLRVATLAELSRKLENRSEAIIQFMPSISKTDVFLIGPGLGPDGQVLTLNNVTLQTILNWYMRMLAAYAAMDTPAALFDPDIEANWLAVVDEVCYEVGHELLAPIHESLLQASPQLESVTFIPYGLLHSIPLHAAKISEDSYWIDQYRVEYSPSSSLLMQTWTNPATQRRRFIGFADAVGDLPMARAEVSHAASVFSGESRTLVGDQASKAEALKQLNKADWIHFACHAKLTFGDAAGSGIFLTSSEENPDAFLDLQELNQRGQLQTGSVVVLSACETGMVMPYFSDEYISLGAGFISAGAGSVISTYWKVKDVCALLIMRRLYEETFVNNQTLSQSVRNAMIHVRELSEQETYSALSTAVKPLGDYSEDLSREVLQQFAARRPNIRPFQHIADWGAFQLVGGGYIAKSH